MVCGGLVILAGDKDRLTEMVSSFIASDWT